MGGEGEHCSVDAMLLHQKEGQALNLWKEPQCLAFAISFGAPLPPMKGLLEVNISSTIFSSPLSMMQCLMSAADDCAMLVMQDDCAMRPTRVRNNHARERRKQSRS